MLSFTHLLIALTSLTGALSASLQQVVNFGPNPTNTTMFIYVPDRLAASPALLVGIHWCSGTAQAFYDATYTLRSMADTYGFVTVYPDAPDASGCWDVHSNATLTHDAGGDSLGIASMTRYAIKTYNVDTNRVFATGISSGAMMTNVLLGAYPDLFKAGAAVAGVPYACFAGPDMWNSQCSNGQSIKTGQQWGDLVRSGYPGFTGTRPKMQLWHGTEDNALFYQNFLEEIKQWANVLGVSETPTSTSINTPIAGYTKTTYGTGGRLEAYSAQGVGHGIPLSEKDVAAFFGLGGTPLPPSSSTTTSRTSSVPTPTATPGTGTAPHWGQCGGLGWSGATVCELPWVCTRSNEFYSQCL